jgi:two-component system, NarL family, nitrate/nitrite response regulator NarL
MKTRIVLADDHPIFRDGLVRTIEEAGDFEVCATGGSAADAVALVQEHAPDMVLLDLSMPGGGITATREIARFVEPPRIAILTVSEDGKDVTDALEAGAAGYILKGVTAAELMSSLRSIAAGQGFISPGLASRVLTTMSAQRKASAEKHPIDDLTKREEDILRRVAKGLSNAEIADELELQEKTVKHYMTSILSKLHARNRVQAALIANEAWRESGN